MSNSFEFPDERIGPEVPDLLPSTSIDWSRDDDWTDEEDDVNDADWPEDNEGDDDDDDDDSDWGV